METLDLKAPFLRSGSELSQLKRIRSEEYDEANVPERDNKIIENRVDGLRLSIFGAERAKYLLRFIMSDANSMAPVLGQVEVWKASSTKYAVSDNMQKLYFCPGKRNGVNDCERLLIEITNYTTSHTCPYCGNTWKAETMMGEMIARLTRQNWAKVLAEYVEKLGRMVDLEGRVFSYGIREANLREMQKTQGGEGLQKVLRLTKKVYYPYANLIRDLNNGSDMESRIRYFLNNCSETRYA